MFTYDPAQADDNSKIRFAIGDNVANYGALPSKQNIQDEELAALVTREGTWELATAAAFEMLAAAWAREVAVSFDNQSYGRQTPSQRYEKLAADWRARFGENSTYTELQGGTILLGFQQTLPTEYS